MSTLTRCNYCSLRQMRQDARKRKTSVILGNEDGWISARYADEAKPKRWFMALSDRCVC